MRDLFLENPWWLAALGVLPVVWGLRRRQPVAALVVPFAAAWWRPSVVQSSRLPAILLGTGLVALIVGLARPQIFETYTEVRQEGHEVVLAIDLSGSMLAEDFERNGERINRLQAIKPVIQAFVEQRPNDRIGLVVFAGKAYTLAPPTFDHAWLADQIEKLRVGLMEDGTAIGDGLGVALTRLEHAGAADGARREKGFIVLLTDGSSNRGVLKPPQATGIAKARGVTVYTIGAGKEGSAPYPIFDEMGHKMGYRRILTDIDDDALREIARATGGQFFRADNTEAIQASFDAIDQSQRTRFETKTRRARDLFPWCLGASGAFIVWGALLARPPLQKEAIA